MLERSAKFDKAVSGSFTPKCKATVYRFGEVAGEVEVESGNWTDDQSASVRRRCDLSLVADPDIIPAKSHVDDFGLWPIGNEIQLWSGIQFNDGSEEMLPIGRFPISSNDVGESSGGVTLSISAMDRSSLVSRARFNSTYQVRSNSDIGSSIKEIIKTRIPSIDALEFRFIATDGSDGGRVFRTPEIIITSQDDPWSVVSSMAASVGASLFFDPLGVCVMQLPKAYEDAESDWDYSEGEGSNLLSASRKIDSEGGYNGVIVDSSNSELTSPIHAEVWNTDPSSPTYFDPANPSASMYGPYPYFYSSEFIVTQEQADQAAESMMKNVRGIVESVSFGAICHPAHESGDLVHVRRDRINVDLYSIMDSIRSDLGNSGTMSVTTRTRRM